MKFYVIFLLRLYVIFDASPQQVPDRANPTLPGFNCSERLDYSYVAGLQTLINVFDAKDRDSKLFRKRYSPVFGLNRAAALSAQHQSSLRWLLIVSGDIELNPGPGPITYSVRLSDSALNNSLRCYTVCPTEITTDVVQVFDDCRTMFHEIIMFNLQKMLGLKFILTGCAEYMRSLEEEEETILAYFSKRQCAVVDEADIAEQINECTEYIKEHIENFEERGSNWVLVRIKQIDIHISIFNPLRAGTWVKLPKYITDKRAVVNVEDAGDNKCFMWSIIAALFPPPASEPNKSRLSHYLPHRFELDFSALTFPVSLSAIGPGFEEVNDVSVNVYGAEGLIFPLRLTRRARARHVNLLLYHSHYAWVRNLDRLLGDQNKHKSKGYYCELCLFPFYTAERLAEHAEHCSNANPAEKQPARVVMPAENENVLQFKSFRKMLHQPVVVYADFECLLEKVASCQPNPSSSSTIKKQLHVPCSFGFQTTTSCCGHDVKYEPYKTYTGQDCVIRFLCHILGVARRAKRGVNYHPLKPLSAAEHAEYVQQTKCWLCDKLLEHDRVRDHCHVCGKFRGAAHSNCNIQAKVSTNVVVIFHNLRRYDGHLLIREVGKLCRELSLELSCIAKSTEDYISFSLTQRERGRKRGVTAAQNDGKIRISFVDSCQFLPASLDALVSSLPADRFLALEQGFPGLNTDLLRRKGVFCYDFLDDWAKLKIAKPPTKAEFHNALTNTNISDNDYEHVLKVWQTFGIQTLQEYMELYLKTDVLLLLCVFEDFRRFSLNNFKLDPCHYVTLPGLAWDACLKITDVKLELLTDPDMYVFFEKGIRGGVSTIAKRYARANNPYLQDGSYDPAKSTSYIMYVDANNLYGWAMEQPLPVSNFTWLTQGEIGQLDVRTIDDNADIGYVLEVDLHYPPELHDQHNCLPLAPERFKIDASMLSPYCVKLLGGKRHVAAEKLVPNLHDKHRYIVHYRDLKFFLEMGLQLKKIHRGISFKQAAWMVPYIRFNTEQRKLATTTVAKNHYKLFNNAVFGKSMQNVRLYMNMELVTTGARFRKLTKRPEFEHATVITSDLVACRMRRKVLSLDRPIYTGFSVLDLSKLLTYSFHYRTIKPLYGDAVSLLMTDTDSFMYSIKTLDVYKDMLTYLHEYDTSDYPPDHFLFSDANKKVVGKMKDETAGVPIQEFVGLRSKMYSFRCGDSEHKRAKGVKKNVVKQTLQHADYVDILQGRSYRYDDMLLFRSEQHRIYTVCIHKKSLASFDDKRHILDDGHDTLAYGHHRIDGAARPGC